MNDIYKYRNNMKQSDFVFLIQICLEQERNDNWVEENLVWSNIQHFFFLNRIN